MEKEKAERAKFFQGYQINHELVAQARENAMVLHCLPAYRDQGTSEHLFEECAPPIFSIRRKTASILQRVIETVLAS